MKDFEPGQLARLSDDDLMEAWARLDEHQRARFEREFGLPAPLADPPDRCDWTEAMCSCASSFETWDYSPAMGRAYSSEIDITPMPDLLMSDGRRLPRDVLRGLMASLRAEELVQLGGAPASAEARGVLDLIDPRSGRRLWEWARNHASIRYKEGVLNWGGHFLGLEVFVEWLDADIEAGWFEKLLFNYYGPGDSLFLAVYYDDRPHPLDLLEYRAGRDGFESLDDWVEATLPRPIPPELLPFVYRWLAAAVRRGRRWSAEEWDELREREWFRHATETLLVSLRTPDGKHFVCRDDGDWIDCDYDVVEPETIESYGFVDRAELSSDQHDRWTRVLYELERIQPFDQLVSRARPDNPAELC